MITVSEIARRLSDDAEGVCRHLLPGGQQKGREWLAGSIHGEAGSSLKVSLSGHKAGVWKDFASDGKGGDLLDLWREARGLRMNEAITEAKQFLRIDDEPRPMRPRRENPKQPPKLEGIRKLEPGGPAFEYLTYDRGLDGDVVKRYRIGEYERDGKQAVVFGNFSPDGDQKRPTALKYLALDRKANGKKDTWSSKDSEWHLFGWQAVPDTARTVAITEGEIDAMTVAGWGFPALSVHSGAGNDQWIDADYDHLERFDEIYLCFDQDEEGRKAVARVSDRLGRNRVRVIELPGKDANECLLAGMDAEAFSELVANAKSMDPPELRAASTYGDEVKEELFPKNKERHGSEFFLGQHFPFRVRKGELTIWTGFSGHGKSLALVQSLTHDISQGHRALIASLEISPAETLAIMARQILGQSPDSQDSIDPALRWLDGRCWLVDHVGVMPWKKLIPIMTYAARRYGVDRFSVDSLLLLGISGEDYDAQRACVSALVTFAGETRSHVHLVAHSKKLDDERKPPSKFDVKGSGDITDLCHNGLTIWRDKKKEADLQKDDLSPLDRSKIEGKPDGQIDFWKQRKTGEEPFRPLWLRKDAMQFVGSIDSYPRRYTT